MMMINITLVPTAILAAEAGLIATLKLAVIPNLAANPEADTRTAKPTALTNPNK